MTEVFDGSGRVEDNGMFDGVDMDALNAGNAQADAAYLSELTGTSIDINQVVTKAIKVEDIKDEPIESQPDENEEIINEKIDNIEAPEIVADELVKDEEDTDTEAVIKEEKEKAERLISYEKAASDLQAAALTSSSTLEELKKEFDELKAPVLKKDENGDISQDDSVAYSVKKAIYEEKLEAIKKEHDRESKRQAGIFGNNWAKFTELKSLDKEGVESFKQYLSNDKSGKLRLLAAYNGLENLNDLYSEYTAKKTRGEQKQNPAKKVVDASKYKVGTDSTATGPAKKKAPSGKYPLTASGKYQSFVDYYRTHKSPVTGKMNTPEDIERLLSREASFRDLNKI